MLLSFLSPPTARILDHALSLAIQQSPHSTSFATTIQQHHQYHSKLLAFANSCMAPPISHGEQVPFRCKRKRVLTSSSPSTSKLKQNQSQQSSTRKHHHHNHNHSHPSSIHHHQPNHQHHHNHRIKSTKHPSSSILTTPISFEESPTTSAAAAVTTAASLYPQPPTRPLAKALQLNIYAASVCRSKSDGEYAGYGIYAPQHSVKIAEPLSGSVQTANKAALRALHATLELIHGLRARAAVIHLQSPALAKAYTKRMRKWALRGWYAESGRPVRNKTLWQDVLRLRNIFIDRGVHVTVRAHLGKDVDHLSFFSDDEIEEEDSIDDIDEMEEDESEKSDNIHMKVARKLARHGTALHVTCGLCGKTHGRQWSKHGCEPVCARDNCDGRVFRNLHAYKKHLNKRHIRICRRGGEECFVGFDDLEREAHENDVHDGRIYSCEFCEKWFRSEYKAKRHMKTRCTKATYCIDCGRNFGVKGRKRTSRQSGKTRVENMKVEEIEDEEEEEQGIQVEQTRPVFIPRPAVLKDMKDRREAFEMSAKEIYHRNPYDFFNMERLRKDWEGYLPSDTNTISSYSHTESGSECSGYESENGSDTSNWSRDESVQRKIDTWRAGGVPLATITNGNDNVISASSSSTVTRSGSSSLSPQLVNLTNNAINGRPFWMAPDGNYGAPRRPWIGRRGRTRQRVNIGDINPRRESSW